jgi:hypothetical protein
MLSSAVLSLSSVVMSTVGHSVKKLLSYSITLAPLMISTRIELTFSSVCCIPMFVRPVLFNSYSLAKNSSLCVLPNPVRRLLIVISTLESIINLTNKRASVILS